LLKRTYLREFRRENLVLDNAISKRIERIDETLKRLEQIKELSLDNFLNDWKSQDATLHNLQIAIEGCLDTGNHILSSIGSKAPETYVQIVEILVSEKILPSDFAETAKNMVKFRNLVVHEYLHIDLKKVYSFLSSIEDIRKFVKYLVIYIEKK